MATTVNPDFLAGLEKFGVKDAAACFNCGNCTAVCPLSSESVPFPRKVIRYLQLGLGDRLAERPEPWLCYYCGECSQTCPRQADPGEVMMGLRRYLTARYDWTGISRRFYTSTAFEVFAFAAVAALVGLGIHLFHGPVLTDRVALNTFAPRPLVERFDLALLAVLSALLLGNANRLRRAVMGPGARAPVSAYLAEFREFLAHFFTQKRFAGCGTPEQRTQWIVHLLVMTGYSVVFLLVVAGLRWFQRDEILPLWHPVRLAGYYATFAILYGTTYAMVGRIRRSKPVYAHSHSSDWAFLVMLWLTTATGLAVHVARLLGWPLTTYAAYTLHLTIAVPMLVVEVPFAKWTHQLYRPLVIYLVKVKERAARTATPQREKGDKGT
ncbi:4Fe-4S dicluster domain-containing protein [Dissulfurirhabdus thermomarina]|uniref:4Fe-4S dicluster domain-containing protein n=1 Tax=Dissulfurirhabdus thermomarina TaxID=1765737 RepID=A0A6N9TUR7_DISTH|nr:4Fe-4S dicluster domain-containing protein [Dissulfurirhabdus thermomarina]NDY42246.1 4Fe-4S dicluster domain-containing protein [Dissulfurirhabdus thermomarina]NMX22977.1 4Fe-4S dicluster domain-containing protein [Dissulfurirhabdus thermomarina]